MQMQPINKKIGENVLKKYGQYIKRINGEIIKVVFEWYERENRKNVESIENINNKKHYRLEITQKTFEQNKTKSFHFNQILFPRFCELFTPMITGHFSNDNQLNQTFESFDSDNDGYINGKDLEIVLLVTDCLQKINQIDKFISEITTNKKLNREDFKEFLTRGFGRELLMSIYEDTYETL